MQKFTAPLLVAIMVISMVSVFPMNATPAVRNAKMIQNVFALIKPKTKLRNIQ